MGKLGMKYMSKALLLFVLLLMTDRGVGYGLKWMYFNQKGEDFYYTLIPQHYYKIFFLST